MVVISGVERLSQVRSPFPAAAYRCQERPRLSEAFRLKASITRSGDVYFGDSNQMPDGGSMSAK
jgi:hypothetical protein